MKKVMAIFLLLVLVFTLAPIDNANADDSRVQIIFVGDSRTVGIRDSLEEDVKNKFTWICEQSKTHSWVKESTQWNQITGIQDKGNAVVVYLMGVNNLDVDGNVKVAEEIADLGFKEVYFGEVTKTDSTKYSGSATNENIEAFNTGVKNKKSTKFKILSLYNSIACDSTTSNDGLHYNAATSKKTFELIMQQLGITSGAAIPEALATAFKGYVGREISDEDAHNITLFVESMRTEGLSDNAIAGFLGNIKAESGFKPYAIEGFTGSSYKSVDGVHCIDFKAGNKYKYETKPAHVLKKNGNPTGKEIGGLGHGLVQWTYGRHENLDRIIDENPNMFGYVTIEHQLYCNYTDNVNGLNGGKPYKNWEWETCRIPNGAGQVALIMTELRGDYKDSVYSVLSKPDVTLEEASKTVLGKYEIPNDWESSIGTRLENSKLALPVVQAVNGVIGSTTGNNGVDGNNSDVQAITQYMQLHGYWTEEQISSFTKLNETNLEAILDNVSRDTLSGSQLEALDNWESLNDDDSKQGGILYYIRVFVLWVGIILIIWAVLMYVGFWFDRSNNFLDFSVIGILTLGKLNASLTDEESTFGTNDKKGLKTINSRQVTTICLVSIIFGVLIVSGSLYSLIAGLVNFIRSIIS